MLFCKKGRLNVADFVNVLNVDISRINNAITSILEKKDENENLMLINGDLITQ